MDEFRLIERFFKPLTKGFSGSFGLGDDAALINAPVGHELVVTTDAICAGVHFIGNEDPALIAQKLLRVNLSDLAAKGAKPLAYFLTLMLPKDTKAEWIERFAYGLKEDQEEFGIHLTGGDTTSTLGPMAFSVTALGTVKAGAMLRRDGAKVGDRIFVSGTLGDGALGLLCEDDREYLKQRYLLPQPRLTLGQRLSGLAHACMDLSDGLMQDLGHLCKASGVGAVIHRDRLPLSPSARSMVEAEAGLWECVYAGGDDYELLFTAPPEKMEAVRALPATEIGEIVAGDGVELRDESEKRIEVVRKGFRHF